VQGKENTASGHLRKLVRQATRTPTGRNTLTTVSGGFAVQLFMLVSGGWWSRASWASRIEGIWPFTESLR
jgi:hypothetical protein